MVEFDVRVQVEFDIPFWRVQVKFDTPFWREEIGALQYRCMADGPSHTPPNIHIHARLCHDKALMDVIPRRWWAKLIVTRENEMMRAMLIAECCEPHGQKELMILPSTEGASITS